MARNGVYDMIIKNVKKLLIIIVFMLSFVTLAKAESNNNIYYINYNDVEMTKEEYDLIYNNFGDLVKYISQTDFNAALLNINSIITLKEEELYIKTTTYNDYYFGNMQIDEIISEEDYNLLSTTNTGNCDVDDVCYQTNAKRISLKIYVLLESKTYTFITTNLWKKKPNVTSFDIIASRWVDSNNKFSMTNYYGEQLADNGIVEYSYLGGNSKYASNGVGISMNILDNCAWNQEQLTIQGKFYGATSFQYFTTYQHAVSSTNLTESKNYTFSGGSTSLGGVLNFANSSIRNKYDGMQGINKLFTPSYFA